MRPIAFRYVVRRAGAGWAVVELSREGRRTEQRTLEVIYGYEARNVARRSAARYTRELDARSEWAAFVRRTLGATP